jgi:hypothetical protein
MTPIDASIGSKKHASQRSSYLSGNHHLSLMLGDQALNEGNESQHQGHGPDDEEDGEDFTAVRLG